MWQGGGPDKLAFWPESIIPPITKAGEGEGGLLETLSLSFVTLLLIFIHTKHLHLEDK